MAPEQAIDHQIEGVFRHSAETNFNTQLFNPSTSPITPVLASSMNPILATNFPGAQSFMTPVHHQELLAIGSTKHN
jgi:hypothetical protein